MRRIVSFAIIALLMCLAATEVTANRFTLVIDAGHGGHDAGAVGAFSKEKNINLNTALAFGRYVERNCPDVRVIYTRKTDTFVTLHGRADIANKAKADLFISIHTNALPGKNHTARGLETYTLGMNRAGDNLDVAKRENSVILVEKDYKERYQGFDPNSAESYIIFEFMQDNNMQRSVDLAKYVQRNVCSTASRPDKGVKQAGFLVLRETSMPSCLIELGFISTPAEEQLLNSESGIDNIARGIYQAFVAYRKKYDESAAAAPAIVPAKVKEDVLPAVPQENRNEEAEKPANEEKKPAKDTKKQDKEEKKPEKDGKKTDKEDKKPADNGSAPVFKVQIFVADKQLKASDSRFKGRTDAEFYKDNGMVKYTVGASTNYNEIYQLRKQLTEKFPDCFIIAFRNGEKMNVNEAIKEFKNNKK